MLDPRIEVSFNEPASLFALQRGGEDQRMKKSKSLDLAKLRRQNLFQRIQEDDDHLCVASKFSQDVNMGLYSSW
jgi:hypothetical protein